MQKDATPSLKGHVRNGKMQQLTGTEKLKDLFYFVLSYTEAAITLVKEHSAKNTVEDVSTGRSHELP